MPDALFLWLEQTALADYFRVSRYGYASLNALHILAIALLVGGAMPKAIWLWTNRLDHTHNKLQTILTASIIAGLLLAVMTGFIMFSSGAASYARLDIFWVKMGLVITGAGSALVAHYRFGPALQSASTVQRRGIALVSIMSWTAALFTGRFIAFAQ